MSEVEIHSSWKNYLENEFKLPYMRELKNFLGKEEKQGKIIYPNSKVIFSALNETPFDTVKVIILGQDPYHGVGQAHGMAFSVNQGVALPPSLKNIYKEISSDLGGEIPESGFLQRWAKQGVLLLNTVLTVEHGKAGSHRGQGWERLTDKIIQSLNDNKEDLVFLLWGAPAQKKAQMIDSRKHLILTAPHPSPLSSYRGFFGCKHFSKTNKFLRSKGIASIRW
jgi:uracil-DNA glycosylase